ncbi:hypothetical protein AB6A40_005599 [Gnathostoma spinigerum]|uniref:GSKIP domain-containing protein n=1 Tax=Gnathostoma spinigerum TaxID=75299 RepID=A0ABD6EFW4_9BILA
MSRSESPAVFTPPSSPSAACQCLPSNIPFHGPSPISFHGRPLTGTPSVNYLADSLGVSPLYLQQDSARWQTAAHVYQTNRTYSPIPTCTTEPCLYAQSATPHLLTENLQAVYNHLGTPLSLVEIGIANRKRHAECGGIVNQKEGGPLELEAIAAVHELASDVRSIAVSEMLPRTADLIFVNIKTVEDLPYTLELTMKGWRVASTQWDSMNGDYTKVELHTKYYENARILLEELSPAHSSYFTKCLFEKLISLGEQSSLNDVTVLLLNSAVIGVQSANSVSFIFA